MSEPPAPPPPAPPLPLPPDFADSRAILIGTGTYRNPELSPLPAALNSLAALSRLLTDPRWCGWPEERVTVIEDAADMPALVQTLRELARETRGVLLLYYVGHGLIRPLGQLCLTLAHTSSEHADVTGLDYSKVREAFLGSPAKVKAVVLDCCFAGRAIEAMAGGAPPAVSTKILGTYILTASDRAAHVVPLAEQADRPTSFTGTLVDLVEAGLPDGPEWLTLDTLYPYLREELIQRGLPVPNRQGTDTAGRFAFARNTAHRPAPARDSRLARALTAALAECTGPGDDGTAPTDAGPTDIAPTDIASTDVGRLAEATGHTPEQVDAYLAGRVTAPRAFLDGFAAFLTRQGRPPAPSRLRELHDLRTAELRDSPDPADQVVYLREVTERLRQAIDDLTAERDAARRDRADERERAREEQERARAKAERLTEQLAAEQERSRRLEEESGARGRQLQAAAGLNRSLEADLARVREQAERITAELLVLRRQVEHLLDPPHAAEPAAPAATPVGSVTAPAGRTTARTAPEPTRTTKTTRMTGTAPATPAPPDPKTPGAPRTGSALIPAPAVRTPPPRNPSTPPSPDPGPRHPRKRRPVARLVARVTAQVLLVLAGLATVALGFSWFVDSYQESVAYLGAPACAATVPAATTDCTRHETGRVTHKRIDAGGDSTNYELTVSREAAPTATYTVSEGLYNSVQTGGDTDLTLWNGRVVEVSHQGHLSPVDHISWLRTVELSLLVGAGTALLLGGLLRSRRGEWFAPVGSCAALAYVTFIGSMILLSVQWASVVTIALAVVGWLAFTVVTAVACWDD
ncbi:caspase, EACC1-associated type [Kitasatospora sp. NPDC002543]